MNGYRDILESAWLRLALLLALVCGGQVYPVHDLHHFHNDRSLGIELTGQFVKTDLDQAADHRHHDHDGPQDDHQTDHHQDLHKGHVTWHINRIQTTRTHSSIDQSVFSPGSLLVANLDDQRLAGLGESPLGEYYHGSFRMFRGPPISS